MHTDARAHTHACRPLSSHDTGLFSVLPSVRFHQLKADQLRMVPHFNALLEEVETLKAAAPAAAGAETAAAEREQLRYAEGGIRKEKDFRIELFFSDRASTRQRLVALVAKQKKLQASNACLTTCVSPYP